MDQLQDPSIIKIVTAEETVTETAPQLQAQDFIDRAMEQEMRGKQDNAITKFLRDAESKRDKEETEKDTKNTDRTTDVSLQKKKDPLNDMQNREFVIEDWDFEYANDSLLRYNPSQLLEIRKSSTIIEPEGLPPRSFYRFRSNQNNTNSGGRLKGNYNSRNFNDGTGVMGNFSFAKKNNERGHNNSRRGRGGRYNKKHEDDSWLEQFEGDGPAGNADDFEKWKAKINSEERKKRGESVPDKDTNENSESSAKNTIDSFFSSNGGLGSLKAQQTSATQNKNSKFFSFFKPEEQQSNQDSTSGDSKDGVSKILSFLDKGEKNSEKERQQLPQSSLHSSPQQSSQAPSSRSQFNFQGVANPSNHGAPQFPPGLGPRADEQTIPSSASTPSQAQEDKPQGAKDSFFMSLLEKKETKPVETQSTGNSLQGSQKEPESKGQPSFAQLQSFPGPHQHQPPQDQHQLHGFPSGFQVPPGQVPPGFPPPPPQAFQNQQGVPRGQFPPGLENNNNNSGKGPQNGPPPGFPNQGGLPPWLAGQMSIPPPHLQQQFQLPNGQFLPPGLVPPPHLRQGQHDQQQKGQAGQQQQGPPPAVNFPPHSMFGRPPPNGQVPPPHMFFPGGSKEGEQGQGRFPPGFFNAPPGLISPQGQQQQQQHQGSPQNNNNH